jgi:nucleotide-binding universal stress UspA family protein
MEHMSSHPINHRPDVALKHIVCGVDGGRRDRTAIAQAIRLADGDGRVTFVAVAHVVGSGVAAQASVGLRRAEGALDAAGRAARDGGVVANVDLVHAADAAEALLQRAEGADLLVVGEPLHSRAGGIAEGATSARVAHRATLPVLIARDPEGGTAFPQQIVLATDGSADSDRAADLTAAIAAAHAAEVTLVHAGASSDPQRRRMREQADRIAEATGSKPVWAVPTSRPVPAICSCAEWNRASLVVIGARGVTGIRALGSVSERVAHAAPCSVLVARS